MFEIIIQTQDGQRHKLSDRIVELVQSIAVRDGISIERAFAQALANETTLQDIEDSGAKLLYTSDGHLRELVRKPVAA